MTICGGTLDALGGPPPSFFGGAAPSESGPPFFSRSGLRPFSPWEEGERPSRNYHLYCPGGGGKAPLVGCWAEGTKSSPSVGGGGGGEAG